jgi:FkbM family methyltransferase
MSRTPRLFARVLVRRRHVDRNKIAFLSLVRRGHTVFDVGANCGGYTSLFSDIVRHTGRVYAFEPVKESARRLRERTQRQANVTVVQRALGSREGRATIFTPDDDLGQASLRRHSAGSWSHATTVRQEEAVVTSLDAFVEETGVAAVDFVKVDIEGSERSFLDGAAHTLRHFRPMIYIELNPSWLTDFDESPATIADRLASLGYCCAYQPLVARGRFRFQPVRVTATSTGDFLFTPAPLA